MLLGVGGPPQQTPNWQRLGKPGDANRNKFSEVAGNPGISSETLTGSHLTGALASQPHIFNILTFMGDLFAIVGLRLHR